LPTDESRTGVSVRNDGEVEVGRGSGRRGYDAEIASAFAPPRVCAEREEGEGRGGIVM
jgi:hypothetical protein